MRGVSKAERILREELERLNWNWNDLQGRAKSHPEKLRIAIRLRHETTMTLELISAQLRLGAPSHLACLLHRQTKRKEKIEATEKTLF